MQRPDPITPHLPPQPSPETGAGGSMPPHRHAGKIGTLVVVVSILALGIPLGVKISSAMSARKTMEASRKATAEAAQARTTSPRSVTLVRPSAQKWTPTVPVEGTLMPDKQVDLAFRAPGTLGTLKVKVGDRVEKGAVIASLDASDLHASQAVAAAQVKAAKVQLFLAEDSNAIASALATTGAAAATSVTQAKGGVGLATANLEAARAQVAAVGVAIRNATITAPFAGVVTMAPTSAGGSVSPGVPLFRLVDVTALRLVGTVSEFDVGLVRVGSPVMLTGATGRGAITSVLPTLDPMTRRVSVEAAIPNAGPTPLLSGAFVRAVVAGETPIDVLALPGTAIRPGSQDEVFVSEAGVLAVRRLHFARGANGELLVRSGLKSTDEVVDAPSPDLVERTKVVAGPALVPGGDK